MRTPRLVIASLCGLIAATPAASPPEHGRHPFVSPDGIHIAFQSKRDGTPDLYVMAADGSHIVRLTADSAEEAIAGWSSDGERLFFAVINRDTSFLYAIRRDGSDRSNIGFVPGRGVRVTTDGRRVVYGRLPWQQMQLDASDLHGGSVRHLTPGSSAFYCSAIARNNKEIATSRSDSGNVMQIWVIDLESAAMRRLTNFPPDQGRPQCPAWSFDGRRIAFQNATADPKDASKRWGHIWVVDVASGAATMLARHSSPYLDETPSWFPDGKHLAFQSDRTGAWEIWIMNSDGSNAHQVTR